MAFRLQPFSRKQLQALHWWRPGSPAADCRIFLADGAIRSGKTVSMILSFLLWSQSSFSDRDFILAGVTAGALKRNVLSPLFGMLESFGVPWEYRRAEGRIIIRRAAGAYENDPKPYSPHADGSRCPVVGLGRTYLRS